MVCWRVPIHAEMNMLTRHMHFSERQIQITRVAQVRHFEVPLTSPIPNPTPTALHWAPLGPTAPHCAWPDRMFYSCSSSSIHVQVQVVCLVTIRITIVSYNVIQQANGLNYNILTHHYIHLWYTFVNVG